MTHEEIMVAVKASAERKVERAALAAFVDTIEATGGVNLQDFERSGLHAPEADPEWVDLGEAYIEACRVLGRVPLIDGEPECGFCRAHPPGSFAPSHDGSTRCESGSLASGGRRSHCSCDTCF